MTDPKDELRGRFQDHVEKSDNTDNTGNTEDADYAGDASNAQDTDSTRSRSQYAMYLSEDLQKELNNSFERLNAQRVLDDKEKVEKHRHFLEGVVRAGLDHPDLNEYVDPESDAE